MTLWLRTTVLSFALAGLFSSTAKASDWSVNGLCQNLFISVGPSYHADAVDAAITSHRLMEKLLHSQTFKVAQVAVFFGATRTGKTFSLTEGLFPVLHARGKHPVLITSDELFKAIEHGFEKNNRAESFLKVDVLAVDDVELPELSFARYKDLMHLLITRYRAGKSTILVTKSGAVAEDYIHLIGDTFPRDFEFYGLDFGNTPVVTHLQ